MHWQSAGRVCRSVCVRVFVQDYEELSLSLSELPLNDHTASELVRLCLRHHDADSLDNESDSGGDDVDADDEVVCHSFYSSAHADVVTLPLPCTLHSSQPAYLCLSLHACRSTCSLRLFNTYLLSGPFVHTSFGTRSFSVAAPKIWNSLSLSLCTCTSGGKSDTRDIVILLFYWNYCTIFKYCY